jgi:hypothetical protein
VGFYFLPFIAAKQWEKKLIRYLFYKVFDGFSFYSRFEPFLQNCQILLTLNFFEKGTGNWTRLVRGNSLELK